MTPSFARRSPILAASRDLRRVLGVRREHAAEVRLAAQPAEQLVVRREELDLAERRDPQLHAGALEVLALDALLDHAAALQELGDIARVRRVQQLELHLLHRAEDRFLLAVGARSGHVGEVDEGVALAGHTLVQLDEHLTDRWLAGAHVGDGVDRVVDRREVLDAERVGDTFLEEQLAAAALRAEMEVTRIGAVHRDAEAHREVALELGRVVRHQVRAVVVGDQRADVLHEPAAARAASPRAASGDRRAPPR